jgi:hypothetical protein
LYLCIPKGNPQTYEQEGAPRDVEKLREYVVQGELLTYYVVVSFEAFRKEQAASKSSSAQSTRSVLEQLTTVFKRLRLVTKFKHGKDLLPVVAHCRVVAHTTTLPTKSRASQVASSPAFGIGSLEPQHDTPVGGQNSELVSREDTPALASDMTESMLQLEEAEQEAYASLSKIGRKLPTSPVVSLDPAFATTLPNGDLCYKLTTRVNLADKFIGSSVTMVVEVSLKDEPMDVDMLLSRLVPKDPNAITPVLSAYTIFSLVDPLKVGFTTSATHMDQFVTVTLENMFSEPLIIGDASLHFSLTEISKRPPVETEKLFNARILAHAPLPLTLHPQESFSFVIQVNACPLGTLDEVGTTRRYVPPSLLLTWRTMASELFLVSQFAVPFPTPQAEQLLLTVRVPQMPLPLNRVFELNIAVTNLASYPRSLAVELPIPDIKSLWHDGFHSSDTPLLDNADLLLQTMIKARAREISVLCIERHVHLGRAEPKGELTAHVTCIAANPGIFAFEGIKVLDKHNREEIRTYIVDAPLELSVIPQDLPNVSFDLNSDSLNPLAALSALRFSTPDPEGDSKTELVLG